MKNKIIRYINVIFIFAALTALFASCSMMEKEESSSVSFKLDNQTIQKIKSAAAEENISSSARSAGNENAFIEVAVHGEYEVVITEMLQDEQTISIGNIPRGVSIYIEAIAYSNVNGKRKNLYKGHSKIFTVKSSENQVMFLMRKIAFGEEAGSSDDNGSGTGGNGASGGSGGSGGNGSGGGNQNVGNVIYISNTGLSNNDGSQAHPLNTINNAVLKIVSAAQSGSVDKEADWTIILLSDISGEQTISDSLDGNAGSLTIKSVDSNDLKTISVTEAEEAGLFILSYVPVTMKDINVLSSGNSGYGIRLGARQLSDPSDPDSSSILYTSTFTLLNGTINGYGTGICVSEGSTFHMKGGSVNCTNTEIIPTYGITVSTDARFYISGNSVVTPYVSNSSSYPICIDGPLTSATGVTVATLFVYNEPSQLYLLTTENGIDIGDVYQKFGIRAMNESIIVRIEEDGKYYYYNPAWG